MKKFIVLFLFIFFGFFGISIAEQMVIVSGVVVVVNASPTNTPTQTPTNTLQTTATQTPTNTPTYTNTYTLVKNITDTYTPSPTPANTATATPSVTPNQTPFGTPGANQGTYSYNPSEEYLLGLISKSVSLLQAGTTISFNGSQPVTGTIGLSAGSTVNIGNSGIVALTGGPVSYVTHLYTAVTTPVVVVAGAASTIYSGTFCFYDPTTTAEAVSVISSGTTFTLNVPAASTITFNFRGNTANSPISIAYSGGATLYSNLDYFNTTSIYYGPLP